MKVLTFLLSIAGVAFAVDCPDFSEYALAPHGSPSSGPLALPYMRPSPACRTFNSSAVEQVIWDMTSRMKDPDLARLFENTFPNTLDTTVKYFNASENVAFIITGDITSLRDTANQFAHYATLLTLDSNLADLVKAIINTESRYVAAYPYCGAFQPPPESGLGTSYNEYAELVDVYPPVDNTTVFECKYEMDSLSGFVKLSRTYYEKTGDSSFMNDNCTFDAYFGTVFRVMDEQAQSSFNEDWEYVVYYRFTGLTGSTQPPVYNEGAGELKLYTGMVGTHHRPSDDLSTFAFLTSGNAMMSVEMAHLADMLDQVGVTANLSSLARTWSTTIKDAIYKYAVDDRGVFAYETNGMGTKFFMDDANVPSLMSLPYLGFLEKDDPNYLATKKVIQSRENPYYAKGQNFSGIGGPHVRSWFPWPMGHASVIFGTDDDQEIIDALNLLANSTSGLGLIHEAVDIYNGSSFRRQWFAWANSYFAEAVLDLAERKPYLIFNDNVSYVPGSE
ncbi:hypothetical protein BDZ89DRAFT_1088090 [Hymenopellis radicata]|nr:hypothetical protein BDZ89DRAFT_1088090 [Hymenopellis radicata]